MAILRTNLTPKSKLNATLKSWLPILQSELEDLEEVLKENALTNPLIKIENKRVKSFSEQFSLRSSSDNLENFSIAPKSLFETLQAQIIAPLFPTEISQKIAMDIIGGLNSEGYFEESVGERARILGVESGMYEKVRKRFSYLTPAGVGAKSVKESFLFQLESRELENNELYEEVQKIILHLEKHHEFSKDFYYEKALKILKSFKNPPAIEFLEREKEVIPELFIMEVDNEIVVRLNDESYPVISLEETHFKDTNYLKEKLKEAKDLIDALNLRKATIYKIGLMLLEYQYDFFKGKELRPLRLLDLANEFNHSVSTISRAISNKYLACERGVFPIKSFFSIALDNSETSNAVIKDYLLELINNENKKKPLSDAKILELIEEKFHLKMVRRTITKYRQLLNIASSSERKKLYLMRA
ncbi:RNA polymerase factor sigma-54 [Helicobacter cetorum]|uniref:RNA polymerase factor sigma-54 n=1 Tax=Helicobacter cetorum (strain ATCC BAA-540 / CCUG 52418 / MIT 99-5656) TaxID=1163745 RepID=I0EQN0_HELCM|nr:RNA polymerase factor sigma-54 [Helicobacter cetorum]AFI05249.1 RNA polymerase factor sigma-54 [Helicobacter cetorum MIT 99-5656]